MPDMPQIYAWTETDDAGYEGVICTLLPFAGLTGNLQHNRLDVAEKFEPIARAHGAKSGNRVRLVRFGRDETVREL